MDIDPPDGPQELSEYYGRGGSDLESLLVMLFVIASIFALIFLASWVWTSVSDKTYQARMKKRQDKALRVYLMRKKTDNE